MTDPLRPYPEGVSWDEAWRQRQRADAAEAEVLRLKEAHLGACSLVAKMHEAAVGEIRCPDIGPVEDIAALRVRADAATAALERIREHLRYVEAIGILQKAEG